MKSEQAIERNWGIDSLRVLCMFMIVIWHILWHGGVLANVSVPSLQYDIAWLLAMLAFGAVNCYGLISGYVGVRSRFKLSNLVELWMRVLFYTLIITIFVAIKNPDSINWKQWLGAFFPVLSKQYWYFTAYTGAFMFFPILNLALEKMERKQIEKILLAMMVMFSLFSTIFQTIYKSDIFILNDGYSVWWLVVLYLLGGYIGKYGILKPGEEDICWKDI